MKKSFYPNLFRPLRLDGLKLKNRITMAPLYLGHAALGGKMSPLLLKHYERMAEHPRKSKSFWATKISV